MPNCDFEILEISDGTTRVDLLAHPTGFCLTEWRPGVATLKRGGTWADTSLADGRRLQVRKLANVVDTFVFAVRNWGANDLARDKRNLRALLDKAANYDPVTWQDAPVWIEARSPGETNSRFMVPRNYETPQDGQPHGSDGFWAQLGKKGDSGFNLFIEREPWCLGNRPGVGTCVEASAEQVWYYASKWEVNTNQPATEVNDIIQLSTGRLLAIDGGDLFTLGGTSVDVWRSDDGTTWTAATTPPAGTNVAAAMAAVSATNIVMTGFDTVGFNGRIWRSTDGGVNWALRSGATGSTFYNSIVYRSSDGYLYITTFGNAIDRSNDEGLNWTTVSTFEGAAIFLTSNDTLLIGGQKGQGVAALDKGIIRSTDGTTWTRAIGIDWGAWAFAEFQGSVYTGTSLGEVYKSTDDGQNWVKTAQPTTSEILNLYTANGSLWIVTGTELFRSNEGTNWAKSGSGFTSASPLIRRGTSGLLYLGEDGDIWTFDDLSAIIVGRGATCNDEIFLANKEVISQLTTVFVFDASGPTYTPQYPAGAFPYNLFPNPFSGGDILYIGIESAVLDSGPWNNVVYDIGAPLVVSGSNTIRYEYSQGGASWAVLAVHDETASRYPFEIPGVGSVHWTPPSDWATDTINGVTAYWIRVRIVSLGTFVQSPTQQNRDIYTVNWNHISIDGLQVPGDLPPLLQFKAHNRSDYDGLKTFGDLDLFANRIIAGVRSSSRGTVNSIINCSDEQNPIGITVTAGTGTAFANDIQAPTGRVAIHTTQARGLDKWDDAVKITIGPSLAAQYRGTFSAKIRAHLYEPSSAPVGSNRDVRIRLQVRSGSGGIYRSTDFAQFTGWDAWDGVAGARERFKDFQLLDMLTATLPASGVLKSTELPDELSIVVQVASRANPATKLDIVFYDVALIPTDEWAINAEDTALEDDSGIFNGLRLNVDSVTLPKRSVRALVESADASSFIHAQYLENTPEPAILQANADQRLHFLAAQGIYRGIVTALVDAQTLTDSRADFEVAGLKVGQDRDVIVYNVTTGNSAIVENLDATNPQTVLVTSTITGGWNVDDEYQIVASNWVSKPGVVHSLQLYRNSRYHSLRGDA